MSRFNIEKFKEALQQFKELKAKNTPYDCEKWKTNSGEENSLADRCVKILESIKNTLAEVSAEWKMDGAEIYVCKGAGYFPKVPWIGILFSGEKPTDGVYPVIGFYEDGLAIGCVESFSRPQGDFWKRCFTPTEVKKAKKSEGGGSSFRHIAVHMSSKTKWFAFSDMDGITAEKLEEAVRSAVEEYHAWRNGKKPWYCEEKVTDVSEWIDRALKKADAPNGFPWVFRGQGNAEWGLEPGLQRIASRFFGDSISSKVVEKLIEYERETLQAFYREVFRKVEYRSFEGVDLLALMQHYGGNTRLLDFSFSPLVALYFALEQNERLQEKEKHDIAVWAVDLSKIARPDEKKVSKLREANGQESLKFRQCGDVWWKFLTLSHEEADAIVNSEKSGEVPTGVDVLVSNVNNERSSAQEGLFLMPKRISEGFETNLLQAIDRATHKDDAPAVVKYVFSADKIDEVRDCLAQLRITARHIYADLEGIAKSFGPRKYFTRCE